MDNAADAISKAKEKMPNITPQPPGIKPQSSAHDLKARLEWGEPGLTIIDVRDRAAHNLHRITGAIPFPMDQLVDRAKSSLEFRRDIYVYGDSDEQTAQAAQMLREAGFTHVSELRGGLAAWKAIAGPTDGSDEGKNDPPGSAYNVVSQVKHHADTQSKDV
jgi:rhodanese-related sulfurtransferase